MEEDTYCHWSHNPELELDDLYSYAGRPQMWKPKGFWVTTYTDDGWREWCIEAEYGCGPYRYDLRLRPGANLLWLKTTEDIIRFTREYELQDENPVKGLSFWLDWKRVKEEYQGIMIFPCQYGARFDMECAWYNTWDCASGCIWKPATVLEIIRHD